MPRTALHRVSWLGWSSPRSSERHVTRREMTVILKEFDEDEKNGVWQWFGVTSELLEKPARPSSTCRARSSSGPVMRYTWPAPRSTAFNRSTQTTATC